MEKRRINSNVKPELGELPQLELNFKTAYNAGDFINDDEVPLGASLTVPGQSMSVKEIMTRYANGLHPGGIKVPVYEGDSDLPDIDRMDLVDRQEFALAARQELEDIRNATPTLPEKIPNVDDVRNMQVPDSKAD